MKIGNTNIEKFPYRVGPLRIVVRIWKHDHWGWEVRLWRLHVVRLKQR